MWTYVFFCYLRVRTIRSDTMMTSHDSCEPGHSSSVSYSRLVFYPVIRININILWFVHVMGNGELHLGAN